MLDRCCVVCYNNHSLRMKGVLEMKVGDLIENLRIYPIGAKVFIEEGTLRVETGVPNGGVYIVSLEDNVSKKSSLSKEEKATVLDAVNLLHNICEGTKCSECVLLNSAGACILKVSLPYSWDLKKVEQNCKEK